VRVRAPVCIGVCGCARLCIGVCVCECMHVMCAHLRVYMCSVRGCVCVSHLCVCVCVSVVIDVAENSFSSNHSD